MRHWKYGIRIFAAIFILLLSIVLASEAQAMSGTGTEADPYIITSAADLQSMRNDLSGHYALGADINMAGFSWTPVGSALDGPFTGSLDGRGCTISYLSINLGDAKFVGLFGYMEGSVRGVTLSDVSIIGGRYTGGIAGNAGVGSTIVDCHVLSGGISAQRSSSSKFGVNVGGIVGLCESNIQGCSNGAKIDSKDDAGGVIGRCAYDTALVQNCSNSGAVTGWRSGGIIGYAELPVYVDDCTNLQSEKGRITGNYSAGGIIGYAGTGASLQLSNCVNAGTIYIIYISGNGSHGYAGGAVGYAIEKSILSRCTNSAYIYGHISSAGMIGFSEGQALLTGCKNSGKITLDDSGNSAKFAAGLVYTWSSSSALSTCENTGDIQGFNSYALANTGTISSDSKSVIQSLYFFSGSGKYAVLPGGSRRCFPQTTPSSNYLDSIVWTSSNESIATVDQDGVVTGYSYGTATITATTTGLGLTASTTVYVAPEMALDPAELMLERGFTAKLTPVRMPEIEDTYTWSSDDSSYVSVDNNGVITAKKTGKAVTITATSVNSGMEATCKVRVIDPIVQAQSVKLSQTVLRPVPGERTQLSATISPSTATDKSITWESSNPAVASVSTTGVVEAVAPGDAVITARTANGLYDTCHVKVVQLSSAAFVIPNSRGASGGTFETAVHLVKNPGIAAFTLEVVYDASALTPVAVTPCDLLGSGTLTSNIGEAGTGTLRVTWYSATDAMGDGPAFNITWRTQGATGSFSISLRYDQADICNAEKIEVRVGAEGGTVYALDRPVGDIYHDDLVNMKDIVYFARYFNEQESLDNSQRLAADLFYDESIDVKDLTALAQVLSENLDQEANMSPALLMDGWTAPFDVTISDAVVEPGQDVTLTVTGANCPGIAALRFHVGVPEGIDVLFVQASAMLSGSGTFAYNSETGIVTWYSEDDQILNGDLFTITLHIGSADALPGAVRLDHSMADFFSAVNYVETPVAVSGGALTRTPFVEFGTVRINGLQVEAEINTNVEQNALLIAAFYQDGKMTAVVTQEIHTAGQYFLAVPTGASGQQCKVFLVDNGKQTPLLPSQRAVNSG